NVNLSLDDSGLLWESIVKNGQAAGSAFHTTIPTAIPEPSTIVSMLTGAGMLGLIVIRRRPRHTHSSLLRLWQISPRPSAGTFAPALIFFNSRLFLLVVG